MEQLHELKNESQHVLQDDPQANQIHEIISKRIETYNEERKSQLLESKANIAYLVGEQNIRLVGDAILPLDKTRAINTVENVLLPAVQKDIAVGTLTAPVFDVVPAGTDDDDRATAITCSKLLKYVNRKVGRDLKRGESILWYDIAGISWRKVYFDPFATVVGINPPPTDEQGNPNPAHIPQMEVGEAITEGELCLEVIPPNQLIWDYRETDLSKLEWIIHAKSVTQSYVEDRFGAETASKLQSKFTAAGEETAFEASINKQFATIMIDNEQQRVNTQKMSGKTEVKLDADKFIDYYEYWQKPTKTAPAGMVAIMLGDQVVKHIPFPIEKYPHGELPFIPCAPMAISGVMSGAISRISQARPLQREYNELCSQIRSNIDVMGNAVIMAPRNAKLNYRTLDNGAGNIIEYEGLGGKPTRESGIPMNSQVFVYLQEKKLQIDNIFAFHEPSQGRAPRNIDSAKGILALQNADTIHMGPIVSAFEQADERVIYQLLTLAVANYPQGKMVNVVGSDYQWTLFQVDRQQLLGKFNVIVRPQSSLPVDKASEAQQTFNLWQSGLLGDPNDPEIRLWVMDQMNFGNNDNLLQKHAKQKNFARKEFVSALENVKQLQVGDEMSDEQLAVEIAAHTAVPPPNVFDDDMVHMADHNEWLLDNTWDLRQTQNPIIYELLNNLMLHNQMHMERTAQRQTMLREAEILAQQRIKGTTLEQIEAKRRPSSEGSTDKKGK